MGYLAIIDHRLPYASLFEAFRAQAARSPEHMAIRDAGRDTTFAALEAVSRQAARALIGLGLEPGDRVSIWAVNHTEWVIAGLGNQAAGGVLIPAGTRLKSREVGAILRRAESRVLFCDPGIGGYDFVKEISAEDLPALKHVVVFDDRPRAGHTMGWDAFLSQAVGVDDDRLEKRITATAPDDLADIIFTSGTTGTPKGVPMTQKQSLIACEQQQLCATKFTPDDVFLISFPFAHNAGYRAGWQAAVVFGVTIIPLRSYDALDVMTLIQEQKVSIMPAAPPIFQSIFDHPRRSDFDLTSLRLATTGGTTIPVTLIEKMQEEFGFDSVGTGYGLTETAGSVSQTRAGDSAQVIVTTTGRPIKNLAVKLVDRDHAEVARGEPGEIAVKGPQVLYSYYRDEEATKAAFTADGYLLTGDVGVFDPDGNLRITDRIKDMYIVGGFNTYPAEIEQQLRRIDGIANAAVIGIADERLGEVGRAFIVRKPGSMVDEAAIIAWCRANMANYKVPRVVTFVEALPLNATGKVSKVDLRQIA